jgi:hypothetical protein
VRRGIIALVWLVAALAVVGLWLAAHDLSDRPQPPAPPNLARALAEPAVPAGPSGDGWKVVHQTSAHYMLVLEVETERVAEAGAIAQQLADPVKDRYAEVLVYLFRPGRRGGLPAARVQWTRRGGYDVTQYEQD